MSDALPFLDATSIRARLPPRAAVEALASALHDGLDPATGFPRSIVPLKNGELLLMPAEVRGAAGVKVATVAPGNAGHGVPHIQGLYVLFDPETLTPRALLDGAELTALRTPAVSLLAVCDRLRGAANPLHIVVVGTGIQAIRHVETTIDVVSDARPIASVTYLARRPDAFTPPPAGEAEVRVLKLGSAESDDAIVASGLVACATSAATPLFDGALVRQDAAVVAVGSHHPERCELDGALMARSCVVVEDVSTALREAGDVVQAIRTGHLDVASLVPLARAVAEPELLSVARPLVFKSTGMAWEDVVVASAVWSRS